MSITTGTFPGVRISDMPDLGVVTDSSSMVGEHAGSGRFSAPALRAYATTGAVVFVTNIAALRALASGAGAVFVQGYHTAGDGGGGIYTHGATGTDNAGSIIVSSGGTYYLDTVGQPLSVKQFGATGDGVTDDTLAIQKTFDVAVALVPGGGVTVHFPGATSGYVTTAAIVINASTPVHVTSDGARLLPGVDYDVFRVTTSSLGVVTFRGFMVFYGTRASVSGVVFRFLKAGALGSGVMDCMVENGYTNISFDGVDDQNCIVSNFVSNGAVGNGIQFLDGFGGNSLISNTSMSTDTLNNGNGILMRAGDGNLLSNVQIQGFLTGFNGTPTAGQLLLDLYCVNVEIDNGLRPDGQGGNGWYFNGSAGGAAINGVYLTNCWGSGNYLNSGWYFNVATNIVMQGCIAVQNGQAGIYFTASCNNVIVQGCLASGNNRAASAFSGIQFSAGMILFSAIGNRCGSTPRAPTASQTYGIAVATGASDHYVIQGNVVQGNVTGGVADGGTGSFKSVSGNVS